MCSGEAKWNVENGLVVLLPHGYDGNGPEHSSCRTERFLLLTDQDDDIPNKGDYDNTQVAKETNMHVAHPSTAANYFHLLRQHQHRAFRKPLIVVAPKKLLRYRGATSDIEEFGEDKGFNMIYNDQNPNLVAKDKVRKVIFCAGQVYFDLDERRTKDKHNDVAILRVESLCPFPFKEVAEAMKQYPNAQVTWSQEEPKNAGGWTHIVPRMRNVLKHIGRKDRKIEYAGRPIMGATAVGFAKLHTDQLAALLEDSFK